MKEKTDYRFVNIGGEELVVKFFYYGEPHYYGIITDSKFVAYKADFEEPVFIKGDFTTVNKLNKRKKYLYKTVYNNYKLFSSHLKDYRRQRKLFLEEIKINNKEKQNEITIVKAATECCLYSKKEWEEGSPLFVIDDNGNKLMSSPPITPDPVAKGVSYCSLKDNFSKKIGRKLALERAVKNFKRKFAVTDK